MAKQISLGTVSDDLARELVRAVEERSKTIGKVLTACLSNGQVDAAGEVKKNIDALAKFGADLGSKIGKAVAE